MIRFTVFLLLGSCAHAQQIVHETLSETDVAALDEGYEPSITPPCTVDVPIRTSNGLVCYVADHNTEPFEIPFIYYQQALEDIGEDSFLGRDGSDWRDRIDSTLGLSREYVALCRSEILNSCDIVERIHPDWEYFNANNLISFLIAEQKGYPSDPETFVEPIPSIEEFARRVQEYVDEYKRRLNAELP